MLLSGPQRLFLRLAAASCLVFWPREPHLCAALEALLRTVCSRLLFVQVSRSVAPRGLNHRSCAPVAKVSLASSACCHCCSAHSASAPSTDESGSDDSGDCGADDSGDDGTDESDASGSDDDAISIGCRW